ncbi:cell division protein ZapA [uncultured Ruminobacter sp.]|jgi:cell division protein ZapA|uniref:cell division protein ZapA n=1 Tax=Ruminobacter sp. TaxID=2774296 RepID=UPI0025F348AC|nr:cell division protein ZapA [uncultured Ruminobacter sp.]
MEAKDQTDSSDVKQAEGTTVTVSVLDCSFHITCPTEKAESMKEAEKRLNEKLDALKKLAPGFSNEKLAILAALDIYHDLINQELKMSSFVDIVKLRLDELDTLVEDKLKSSS